jgi:hypothetical protein
MINEAIIDLQREIRKQQDKIDRCNHDWNQAYQNNETVREPSGFATVAQGSDVWSEPTGYHDVVKSRWTRICKKCGGYDHTYKDRPIIVGREPDFGR